MSTRSLAGPTGCYQPKKPPVVTAKKKLGNREDDWNLAGKNNDGDRITRTRGGGNGRPQYIARKKQFIEPESSDSDKTAPAVTESEDEDEEEDEDDVDVELTEADDPPVPETPRTSATRVIIEVDALMQIFEKHCRCAECYHPMKAELKTICLATQIILTCNNCGYIHYSMPPAAATVGDPNAVSRERNTDSAINILYVLGFISVGDGCSEAGCLLGLLGLPNHTTMESRSFTAVEERISPYIQQLTDEIIHENLSAEVQETVVDPSDFANWKQDIEQGTLVLSRLRYPNLNASYDMAWQQRNSGNRYDSASGHALLVGAKTRRPIAVMIKSKLCNMCSTWKMKHDITVDPVPLHNCRKNHEGTSGSMEPLACLEMTVDMFERGTSALSILFVSMMMRRQGPC
jgi:hypothetical protein